MKKQNYFLFLFILIMSAFISYRGALALFSDSGQSSNNIFGASSTFPIPTPQAGDIVINEINWGGSNGDGNDEWVELRNTKNYSINLNGWVVENLGSGGGNANITIPSGSIAANGFFLITALDKANSKINVDPDYTTSKISLNNGGEQLKLKTNTNVLIDTANGTEAWFAGNGSTPKKSMERKSSPGDGTVSTNWQTATTHTGMDGNGSSDEFGTPKNSNP